MPLLRAYRRKMAGSDPNVSARGNNDLSIWTTSKAKRIFDVAVILACLPVILPLLLVLALTVLLSSGSPAVFRQTRIGHFGNPFTIYKLRTMCNSPMHGGSAIATALTPHITPIGRLLRRLKLDELPQVWNVLAGQMSLVGPRPRVPSQQLEVFACRPGITGPAALAFAREDVLLAKIPSHELGEFYQEVILPEKQRLDSDYLRKATLLSDLRILLATLSGRWGSGSGLAASCSSTQGIRERMAMQAAKD